MVDYLAYFELAAARFSDSDVCHDKVPLFAICFLGLLPAQVEQW
jgi:hypothetical protein